MAFETRGRSISGSQAVFQTQGLAMQNATAITIGSRLLAHLSISSQAGRESW